MFKINVEDMSCNHCVTTITKALKAVAPQATVHVDLDNRRVDVDGIADQDTVLSAINNAGFTARPAHD